MNKSEFHLDNTYAYNRAGPVRWILSHVMRYPWLPVLVTIAAILNNFSASFLQVYIGRAFDLITQPTWETAVLLTLAASALAVVAGQSLLGIVRNFTNEFIAQLIERNARDELYVDLLGKSQTFHGQQRIGDIMARATNDVRTLNIMFSPGVMLIVDTVMAIIAPMILIATLRIELLLVPSLFLILFVLTVWDYSRRLNPVSLSMREQFGVMNAGLAESIGGIEVVKGNAQEAQEIDQFSRNATSYRDYFIKQGEIQAMYLPLLVYSIALGLGFFHAMWLWHGGTITLGEVVTFMGLFGILRFPTFISIFSFNLVQLGIASARRILELLNAKTNLDENEAGHQAPI
ncbi:MAG: hypothetical protein KC421_12615, partial [Anaerolineales bacterium]|nr:hypothetical protein [Anaerolineales bacterium]